MKFSGLEVAKLPAVLILFHIENPGFGQQQPPKAMMERH
jgi:hypothetical protein